MSGFAVSAIINAQAPTNSGPVDFWIQTSPTTQTLTQGASTSFTISLYSLHGFAGSVDLSSNITPANGTVVAGLNTNPVSLLSGSGSATLTVNAASNATIGSYSIAVGATSGRIIHIITLFVQVSSAPAPDYSIIGSPASLTLSRGNSGGYVFNLTSLNGFSGSVSLSSMITPNSGNSPSLSLNPTSLTLLANGTAQASLAIMTNSSTVARTYTITIMSSSGSLSHSAMVTLIVQ